MRPTLVLLDPATGFAVPLDDDATYRLAVGQPDRRVVAIAVSAVRRGQPSGQTRPNSTAVGQVPHDGSGSLDVVHLTEAARMLGMSDRTLRRRVASGQVPAHRDGRRLIFRTDDLTEYLDARRT